MAPPRRVRDEALTLRRTGLPDIELFRAREAIYLHQYPTQGRFQVAPNAQAIAFTTPGKNELTLVRHDGTMMSFNGVYQDQFRISPDSQTLTVARYFDNAFGMSRIDLRSKEHVSRDALRNAVWSEFCADGLVVLENNYVPGSVETSLVLLPWKGERSEIARIDSNANRFACAKAGRSVAYFPRGAIWSIAEPGAKPALVAEMGMDIKNAEMSPDGRSLIVLTARDAYLFEDGKLASTLGMPNAHTVWFSRDGSQFVVATAHEAHWQRGNTVVKLKADDEKSPIRTARFAPMSPWIMVARGAEAIRWNPAQNESEAIAFADEGQEMLGVDVFGGGVLIWTGSTWQLEDPRKRID